jgi:Zn-dependent peptidase ImmA (M78 family)/DNA-binding XRE family transcriptional regulator
MNNEINSEMILLARESKGITQSALAKRLNVTQAAISKAEKGQIQISDSLLNDIARVLEYPIGFFFQSGHCYPPTTPFHRKKQGLGKKLQHKIEATANVRRLHIQKLMDSIDIERKEIPCFDIEEYINPANVAIATRRYLQLPKGPIGNMTKIIEQFGIPVILCAFNTERLDGFTLVGRGNTLLIFINNDMPWCRIRFTLAHELGHIVMKHIHKPGIEEEANEFAASFLMPKEDIEKDFWMKKISISDLADLKPFWKVSMQALLIRAKNLDCINKNQAKYLWMNLSKLGYRKKEPHHLDIQPESPTLLASIVNVHKVDLEYTEDEFFSMLATTRDDFDELYPSLREPKKKKVKLRLVK